MGVGVGVLLERARIFVGLDPLGKGKSKGKWQKANGKSAAGAHVDEGAWKWALEWEFYRNGRGFLLGWIWGRARTL